jgi:hypothetical protein
MGHNVIPGNEYTTRSAFAYGQYQINPESHVYHNGNRRHTDNGIPGNNRTHNSDKKVSYTYFECLSSFVLR